MSATAASRTSTPTNCQSCARRRTNRIAPSARTPYSSSFTAADEGREAVHGGRDQEPRAERDRRGGDRARRLRERAAAEQTPRCRRRASTSEREVGRDDGDVRRRRRGAETRLVDRAEHAPGDGRAEDEKRQVARRTARSLHRWLPSGAMIGGGYDWPPRHLRRAFLLMRIVVLSGIWPPDVGGPATHGPELARFLAARGHDVRVVTMADGEVTERPVPGLDRAALAARSRSATASSPGCAALDGAERRRHLRDRDVRRRGGGIARPRASRSSRSSSPTRPTSARSGTAPFAARSRSSRTRPATGRRRAAPLRGPSRSRRASTIVVPSRVPRRDRPRLGARRRTGSSC